MEEKKVILKVRQKNVLPKTSSRDSKKNKACLELQSKKPNSTNDLTFIFSNKIPVDKTYEPICAQMNKKIQKQLQILVFQDFKNH